MTLDAVLQPVRQATVTAQVARQIEHDAPAVTKPDSAPVSSASLTPTLFCRS